MDRQLLQNIQARIDTHLDALRTEELEANDSTISLLETWLAQLGDLPPEAEAPFGLDELLQYGVNLSDIGELRAWLPIKKSRVPIGQPLTGDWIILRRAEEELYVGEFERAISAIQTIINSAQAGKSAQKLLADAQTRQTRTAEQGAQLALKLQAANAPEADIKAVWERVQRYSPNNQKAERALRHLDIGTRRQDDDATVADLSRRIANSQFMDMAVYPEAIANLQSLITRYDIDPVFRSTIVKLRDDVQTQYDRYRNISGQATTAEGLKDYQTAINSYHELIAGGAKIITTASGDKRDINQHLNELEGKLAEFQVNKAEERLGTAKKQAEEGDPINALVYLNEAEKLLGSAELNMFRMAAGEQQKARQVREMLSNLEIQYTREKKAYDQANVLYMEAEALRELNIDDAYNKLRATEQFYKPFKGLAERLKEYEHLREKRVFLDLDRRLFMIDTQIDAVTDLTDMDSVDVQLSEMHSKLTNAPEAVNLYFRKTYTKASEMRKSLKALETDLEAVRHAIRQNNISRAKTRFEGISAGFQSRSDVVELGYEIDTYDKAPNAPEYHRLVHEFKLSHYAEVKALAEKIDPSSVYIDQMQPYLERANIYLLEKTLAALDQESISGIEEARLIIHDAQSIAAHFSSNTPMTLEPSTEIVKRLAEAELQIKQKLNSLGAVGVILGRVDKYRVEGAYANALRELTRAIGETSDPGQIAQLRSAITNIEADWYASVKREVRQAYLGTEAPDAKTIAALYNERFEPLHTAGLLRDADGDWERPLLRDYYYLQAGRRRGEDGLGYLHQAIESGLEMNVEVQADLDRRLVEVELDKMAAARANQGPLEAGLAAWERWRLVAQEQIRRNPPINDRIQEYLEEAISQRAVRPETDVIQIAQEHIQAMSGLDEHHAALGSYWRKRLDALRYLRAAQYSAFLTADKALRSTRMGLEVTYAPGTFTDSLGLAMSAILNHRLRTTELKLDSWRIAEAEAILQAVEQSAVKPVESIVSLSWAYQMNPENPLIYERLLQLGAQITEIVHALDAEVDGLAERTMRLLDAEKTVARLIDTTALIQSALAVRKESGDNPLRGDLTRLSERLNTYEQIYRDAHTAYQESLELLDNALRDHNIALMQKSNQRMADLSNQKGFQQISDLMLYTTQIRDIAEAFEILQKNIVAIKRGLEMEEQTDTQHAADKINEAVMNVRRLSAQVQSPFKEQIFNFTFAEKQRVVSNTRQQNLTGGGHTLIHDGQVSGLEDHIAVTQQRVANARSWTLWWNTCATAIDKLALRYMRALHSTDCLVLPDGLESLPFAAQFTGLGLKDAIAAMEEIQTGDWLDQLDAHFGRAPQEFVSIRMAQTLLDILSKIASSYPHPQHSDKAIEAELEVPLNELPTSLVRVLRYYLHSARNHAKQQLPLLKAMLPEYDDKTQQVEDLISKYNQALNDFGGKSGFFGQRKKLPSAIQMSNLVSTLEVSIHEIQRHFDASYRCYDKFDVKQGTYKSGPMINNMEA